MALRAANARRATSKNQRAWKLEGGSKKPILDRKRTYDWAYDYGSSKPHAATRIGGRDFAYDANGNQTGWQVTPKGGETPLAGGASQPQVRAQALDGSAKAGEGATTAATAEAPVVLAAHKGGLPRPKIDPAQQGNKYGWLKNGKAGGSINPDSRRRTVSFDEENRVLAIADNGRTTRFAYDDDWNRVVKQGPGGTTLYVNQWYVAGPGRNSKHVFAGATRIATKLEAVPKAEQLPQTLPLAALPPEEARYERFQFFYHPDHLGSTSFVTDEVGAVAAHLAYFPFGESWVEEARGQANSRVPYRFTAKELDQGEAG